MARVAIQEEDWANAISYSEKGRKLTREIESERGIKLPVVHTSLDEALGVALVPYYPPKHHQRASRLLTGVLKDLPADYEARFNMGVILQTANNWAGAREHFQTLLDQGGEEKEMVAAREELGWCLVNEGSSPRAAMFLRLSSRSVTRARSKRARTTRRRSAHARGGASAAPSG